MIVSFKHRGLELFYQRGSTRGIQANHANKLTRILQTLDAATSARGMNLPGFELHALKGNLKGRWSVSVNGNWRVTFRFIDRGAEVVDYQDYH